MAVYLIKRHFKSVLNKQESIWMQTHFQIYTSKTELLLYIQIQISKTLMLNNTNDGNLIL